MPTPDSPRLHAPGHATRGLIPGLLALATLSSLSAQGCPQSVEPKPYPGRQFLRSYVGWGNQVDRYEDELAVCPYLIPLEVQAIDTDTMLLRCDQTCTEMSVPGDWIVDWTVESVPGSQPGSLVDAQAQKSTSLSNRRAVMFLPPTDLGIGQMRVSTILATIRDRCNADDGESVVAFTAITARAAASHWLLAVYAHNPGQVVVEHTPCDGSSATRCTLYPPPDPVTPGNPPFEAARDFPTEMFVDEIRPLMFDIRDLDHYQAECGPVIGPGATQLTFNFCDTIKYSWAIANQPGETGMGEFILFGTQQQTVLFKGTAPGTVRVRVTGTSDTEGDTSSFEIPFLIMPRTLESIDFDAQDQQPIFPDGEATSYEDITQRTILVGTPPAAQTFVFPDRKGVEWYRDRQQVERDHDYPMAYVRDVQPLPKIVTLYVEGGGTAGYAIPMPGTFVLCEGVGDPDNRLRYLGANDPDAPLEEVVYHGFVGDPAGRLPNEVGKHSFRLKWSVLVHPGDVAAEPFESEHRFYTTLAAPLPMFSSPASSPYTGPSDPDAELWDQHYQYWESAYDIACTEGSGAANAAALRVKLTNGFAGSVGAGNALQRKEKDGWSVTDDTPLKYWGEFTGAHNYSTHQQLHALLTPSSTPGVAPDGVGSCVTWAQLFRLTLALHGEKASCRLFVVQSPFRQFGGGGGVMLRGSVNVEFLVKKWAFTPMNVSADPVVARRRMPPALQNFDPMRVDFGGGAQQFWLARSDIAHGAAPDPLANCHEDAGAKGQGVDNPPPNFVNHWIVSYGNRLFDPSYGSFNNNVGWPDVAGYSTASLDGFIVPDLWDTVINSPRDVAMKLYQGPNAPTARVIGLPY